ncbi:hypothetical protein [Hartmannibacter diazotrophicus]|nr:hypothetical protein [Hartmannibacter diazotrophicus]
MKSADAGSARHRPAQSVVHVIGAAQDQRETIGCMPAVPLPAKAAPCNRHEDRSAFLRMTALGRPRPVRLPDTGFEVASPSVTDQDP